LFAIKALERTLSLLLQLRFLLAQPLQELTGNRIAGATQLLHPLHHYLAIAQRSQAVKQTRGLAPHFLPSFVRIDGAKSISHGAAAAKCHAKVMDRLIRQPIRCPGNEHGHFQHPVCQPRLSLN
jgi:hypothetical protein